MTSLLTGHDQSIYWSWPVVKPRDKDRCIYLLKNNTEIQPTTSKGYISASQTLQEIANQPITLHKNVEEEIANKDEIILEGFSCAVEGCEKKCKSEQGLKVHLAWHKRQ